MLPIHILSAIIGLGSSTIRSFLFLRQGALNQNLQKMVGASLLILGITGFGLAFAKPSLFHEPKFLMKMFFVGMLFASEAALAWKKNKSAALSSLFTWYFSFLWSGILRLRIDYLGILGIYFGILLAGILIVKKIKAPSSQF